MVADNFLTILQQNIVVKIFVSQIRQLYKNDSRKNYKCRPDFIVGFKYKII